MTLSPNYTFDLQRDQIIKNALIDVGAIGVDGTPTANQKTHAQQRLNVLAASLEAEGALLWRVARRTQSLTASTANYTLAADVLDIEEPISYRTSATETARTTLKPLSRDEYMAVTDRTTEGAPAMYYLEKLLAAPVLYLYPTPDTTGAEIEYAASIRGKDFDSGSVTPDFPRQWLRTLQYGLALELCPAYAVPAEKQGMLLQMYEAEKAKVLNDNTERGGIRFVPFANGGYSGESY